jgi:hypothetical protein
MTIQLMKTYRWRGHDHEDWTVLPWKIENGIVTMHVSKAGTLETGTLPVEAFLEQFELDDTPNA